MRMKNYYTTETRFYGNYSPQELVAKYGSPLYVYNEAILRERCREMVGLVLGHNFGVHYSIKANSNLELLRIIKSEAIKVGTMSDGEIELALAAGFLPEEILYIPNNVSTVEMKYAISRQILLSVDSLAQLEQYGELNPGGKVVVRFNPGVGIGHHQKVRTGGERTKFGVNLTQVEEVKDILEKYALRLVGINQHLGSLFMKPDLYLAGARALLELAIQFENLEFVNFGGGFGIPYHKQTGEARLDLTLLGRELAALLQEWTVTYHTPLRFEIEPGRYLVAECGVLLGTVHATKESYGRNYVGTDLGFNVIARPVLYDSYHELEVYTKKFGESFLTQKVTVVGNICESGDIIAAERELSVIEVGDLLGVMDAGAYGFAMSSNYNARLRPAEVLIRENGTAVLIRYRETIADLMRAYQIDEAL